MQSTENFGVIIPARYASSRLPGKPLMEIAGQPMIYHVWQRAQQSNASWVVIATDDQRIANCVEKFGGKVIMTSKECANGTARLAEAVKQLKLANTQCVVNLQGDEPLLPSLLINQVARCLLSHPFAAMATLAEFIEQTDQLTNPNIVKVVCDQKQRALYFSRAVIPYLSVTQDLAILLSKQHWLRHIGLYAYRVHFIHAYSQWEPSPLEQIEQLEQLRALYYGQTIQVAIAQADYPGGVDTIEDLAKVRQWLQAKTNSSHSINRF